MRRTYVPAKGYENSYHVSTCGRSVLSLRTMRVMKAKKGLVRLRDQDGLQVSVAPHDLVPEGAAAAAAAAAQPKSQTRCSTKRPPAARRWRTFVAGFVASLALAAAAAMLTAAASTVAAAASAAASARLGGVGLPVSVPLRSLEARDWADAVRDLSSRASLASVGAMWRAWGDCAASSVQGVLEGVRDVCVRVGTRAQQRLRGRGSAEPEPHPDEWRWSSDL
jgi:hypothetical protein